MKNFVRALMLASCIWLWAIPQADGSQWDDHLVLLVLHEAENQPFPGMVAVAGVALDRVKDERWPQTLKRVIYQPAQFTDMGKKMRQRYDGRAIRYAIVAVEVARTGTRPCGNVLWYHTTEVDPAWAHHTDKRVRCQIGDHIFYKDSKR